MSKPHICVDRVLSRDLARPQQVVFTPGWGQRAIAPKNRQWANGSTLSVAFIGGTEAQRSLVRSTVPQWSQHANLRFDFRASLPANIRIAFDPNDGAWSYIGLDNLEIPATSPTMNIGWDNDPGMILHEAGHCIGLAHEHQSPFGGIQWNEAQVIADLSGPPNFWDEATIRHNVLEKYSVDQVIGTSFDNLSIMLYSIPASWTLNGVSTPWNTAISSADAAFVGSDSMYPRVVVAAAVLPVLSGTPAAIVARNEQDEWEFEVRSPGIHVIETAGTTDVVASLYRNGALVASDDDSGRGRNARIVANLSLGTYKLVIKHYSTGTGPYKVIVWT